MFAGCYIASCSLSFLASTACVSYASFGPESSGVARTLPTWLPCSTSFMWVVSRSQIQCLRTFRSQNRTMIRENEPNHDDRQLFVACVFK